MVTGTQVTNPTPAGRSRALVIVLSFVAGVLVAVGGLLLVVRTSQGLASTISSWFQRTTHTDMSRATIVDRIQKLQRLETVVYTMDKIVTGEKGSTVLPDFLAGDRLLLLVHGEVIAGIDFETLKPGDVAVAGRTVHVRIPQSQLLVTRLDSSKTRVYSRQTGLLVPTDPNLESQVRDEAERELRRSALADGILQKAQENARTTMTGLIRGMGFEGATFE